MNKLTFIHIGLPKTGTTFLQTKVFPNISNTLYLGKHYTGDSFYNVAVVRNVITKINNGEQCASTRDLLAEYLKLVPQEKLIISDETLCGLDEKQIAKWEAIKYYFPNCKLLCVRRQPTKFCESYYNFILKERGGIANDNLGRPRISSLKLWIEDQLNGQTGIYYLLRQNFYDELKSIFCNITFIKYEHLFSEQNQFNTELNHFFEVEDCAFNIDVKTNSKPSFLKTLYLKIIIQVAPNFFMSRSKFGRWILPFINFIDKKISSNVELSLRDNTNELLEPLDREYRTFDLVEEHKC